MSDLLPSHNAAYNKLLAEATTLRAKVLRDADDLASLRKQLEDAREALRFYANLPCNLEFGVVNECPYDDGATAREALKGKS